MVKNQKQNTLKKPKKKK